MKVASSYWFCWCPICSYPFVDLWRFLIRALGLGPRPQSIQTYGTHINTCEQMIELISHSVHTYFIFSHVLSHDVHTSFIQPPWTKTCAFNNVHARNFQECNFQEGERLCGMQLANPGLLNSRILRKLMTCAISHAQNSQECCFCWGKSPCGTHGAG